MYPPQYHSDAEKVPGANSAKPDPVVLGLVWLFTVTLGANFGYWPPRVGPRWLSNLVVGALSVGGIWLGLTVMRTQVLVAGDGLENVALGLVAILMGVAGLGWLLVSWVDASDGRARRKMSIMDRRAAAAPPRV